MKKILFTGCLILFIFKSIEAQKNIFGKVIFRREVQFLDSITTQKISTEDKLYIKEPNSQIMLRTGGSSASPPIAFEGNNGTYNTGFWEGVNNEIHPTFGGSTTYYFNVNGIMSTTNKSFFISRSSPGVTTPIYSFLFDENTGMFTASTGDDLSFSSGGVLATRYLEVSDHILRSDEGEAGITASTTQSQGQRVLLSSINEISVVANVNDVVTMPEASQWRIVRIINNGVNTLQIFPSSGDNLGAGVNISITLISGSNATYIAYDNTNWETF